MKTNKTTNATNEEISTAEKSSQVDYKVLYENELGKVSKLIAEKDEWQKLAKIYSEKFAQALKGFLIMQGSSESQAELERQKILNSVKIV